MATTETLELGASTRAAYAALMTSLRIDGRAAATLLEAHARLAAWVAKRRRDRSDALIIGVCGAQGTGKTTLCRGLEVLLTGACGLRVVGLSLDDLYLTGSERKALARTVHPLLGTRDVPGTHDVELARCTLGRLRELGPDEQTEVPRFDKALDDRSGTWEQVGGPIDVVVFEGWCVGARAGPKHQLSTPVNERERAEDPDGRWRRYVDDALRGPYQDLFDDLDALVLLRAPDWECVRSWREVQEAKLRDDGGAGPGVMTPAEVQRFLMLFERITRDVLAEMPGRADAVVDLDRAHEIVRMHMR